MAIYEFRCRACGQTQYQTAPADRCVCKSCGSDAKRVWGFNMPSVMHEQFDPGTGTVISDRKKHAAMLRQKSDEATQRTGMPHNFVPADLRDTKALGVTDEGLGKTYDKLRSTGEIGPGAKWPI